MLDHLRKLGVAAVELMPITAAIDERHLPPLGLRNAWGYNPVVPMALCPERVPGGVAELVATVAALRQAGIGVILDLVFNHMGESDIHGGTLSFRGLDPMPMRGRRTARSSNDAGTGNTLDASRPSVRAMILDSFAISREPGWTASASTWRRYWRAGRASTPTRPSSPRSPPIRSSRPAS